MSWAHCEARRSPQGLTGSHGRCCPSRDSPPPRIRWHRTRRTLWLSCRVRMPVPVYQRTGRQTPRAPRLLSASPVLPRWWGAIPHLPSAWPDRSSCRGVLRAGARGLRPWATRATPRTRSRTPPLAGGVVGSARPLPLSTRGRPSREHRRCGLCRTRSSARTTPRQGRGRGSTPISCAR